MYSGLVCKLMPAFFCFLVSFFICVTFWWWISSFLKIGGMAFLYIILVPFLLALFFCASGLLSRGFGAIRVLFVGFVAGLFCGFLSLIISNIAIPNGVERLLDSIPLYGFDALLLDLTVSVILGGWLVGGISFLATWLVFSRSYECGLNPP